MVWIYMWTEDCRVKYVKSEFVQLLTWEPRGFGGRCFCLFYVESKDRVIHWVGREINELKLSVVLKKDKKICYQLEIIFI